jgi:hypothetical protein
MDLNIPNQCIVLLYAVSLRVYLFSIKIVFIKIIVLASMQYQKHVLTHFCIILVTRTCFTPCCLVLNEGK